MNTRPRLLFLCTRFPHPLDRGDRLRNFHFAAEFSELADVTLVAFTDSPVGPGAVRALGDFCSRALVVPLSQARMYGNLLQGLGRRVPLQVSCYRSGPMARLVDGLAAEPWDAAFGSMFRVLPYLERIPSRIRILDLPDSDVLRLGRAIPTVAPLLRPVLREELRRADAYERRALGHVTETWVTARPDREEILGRVPAAHVALVPNGVETRWGRAALEGAPGEGVLFLGNMTVQHNRDAVRFLLRDIWPRVLAHRPGATLRLVGEHGPGLRRQARLPGVVVEGYQEDLAPILRRSRAAVSPLRFSSGLQNKVLETIAAGLPTVVTSMVAEPLGAPPGSGLVIADSAPDIASALVRLMENPDEARGMGAAGSAWVRESFPWGSARARLAVLLEDPPGGSS